MHYPIAYFHWLLLVFCACLLTVRNAFLNDIFLDQEFWFRDHDIPQSPPSSHGGNNSLSQNDNLLPLMHSSLKPEQIIKQSTTMTKKEKKKAALALLDRSINRKNGKFYEPYDSMSKTSDNNDFVSNQTIQSDGWSLELKGPYLNATRLKESGHFDQVVQAWAQPFRNKSFHVCSLERRVRAIIDPGEKGIPGKPRPQLFSEPIQGIYYVKVPKSGSSTLAGINKRIALRWGWRLHGSTISNQTMVVLSPSDTNLTTFRCTHAEGHVIEAGRYYGNRVPEKSFLWGSVRDPASRALSRVFFSQISQFGQPETDRIILRTLKKAHNPQFGTTSPGKGGFQLQYLSLNVMDSWFAYGWEYPKVVQQYDLLEAWVKNVTEQYDFIAVSERMDESLVALQLLLGLEVGDILPTSAKIGGGYHYRAENATCIFLQKPRRSPSVKEYLESDEWQAFNYGDYLLYAAANRSLDLTIERLGKERFDAALAIFRAAKQVVDEKCVQETHFPCAEDGTLQYEISKQNCYHGDEGCGYPCIDRMAYENGW